MIAKLFHEHKKVQSFASWMLLKYQRRLKWWTLQIGEPCSGEVDVDV